MTIELPDDLHARLLDAAAEEGVSPVEWIAVRLRRRFQQIHSNPDHQTLTDRLVSLGLVGVVDSGGAERLSGRHSEVFGEMLEEEHRTRHP